MTNFHYDLAYFYTDLIYITFDSGTARPIQRKLTSQLQSETESAEDRAKITEHLELSADLTKLLLPVLLEVSFSLVGKSFVNFRININLQLHKIF